MQTEERKEMRLLDKGKQGLLRIIFSRTGVILLLFVVGVLAVVNMVLQFAEWLPQFVGLVALLQIAVMVELFNNKMGSTAKNTWFLVICVLPIIGCLFYIYTRIDPGSLKLRKTFLERQDRDRTLLPTDTRVMRELEEKAPDVAALCKYVDTTGNFPVYDGTKVDFFELGEYKWKSMLEDLEKAEKFIFAEYFIIAEGKMWGQILDILARKAAKGVDVRVMYDGTCEFSTLPHDYPKRLQALGIRCQMFAPMTPFLTTAYNNRDHRKILVIDGKVAYNGGVNLADEYINAKEVYGHWKDTAVRIEGPAVDSFTVMFLEMWIRDYLPNEGVRFMMRHTLAPEANENMPPAEADDFGQMDSPAEENLPLKATDTENLPEGEVAELAGQMEEISSDSEMQMKIDVPAAAANVSPVFENRDSCGKPVRGYVMPYADNPLDDEKVGENVYMDFLYRAKQYVHIMTPYLILDDELTTALVVAAKKGIDVQLILPGIPDKKMVYMLAKSYFGRLIEAGVKIYIYTPGFVHAKIFVSDDCKATVGTINLDYRSLSHHFECGTFLYDVPCISEIEWDFLATREKCHRVTMEDVKSEKLLTKAVGRVMRMIAPLL